MIPSAIATAENEDEQVIALIVDNLSVKKAKFQKDLERSHNFRCIEFKTIHELFQYCTKKPIPNIVLMDIKKLNPSERIDSIDVITSIKTLFQCTGTSCSMPQIGVIVDIDSNIDHIKKLSNSDVKIIAPGNGFNESEIAECMDDIKSVGKHIPRQIAKRIADNKQRIRKKTSDSDVITLTPRQEQIMNLICSKGYSNKMIGKVLNLSESTIKLHISAILKKYRLKNRTQLALMLKEKDCC